MRAVFCTVSELALLPKSIASAKLSCDLFKRLTNAPINVSPAAVVNRIYFISFDVLALILVAKYVPCLPSVIKTVLMPKDKSN